MIIGRSNYALASSSTHVVERTRAERLRVWDGREATRGPVLWQDLASPGPELAGPARSPGTARGGAGAAGATGTRPGDDVLAQNELSARSRFTLLIALVEKLTGQRVRVLEPDEFLSGQRPGPSTSALSPPWSARLSAGAEGAVAGRWGWGVDYQLVETRAERESTRVVAVGTATTTDGRQIAFSLDVAMARESVEVSSFRLRAGDAAMTDPLVLTFDGGMAGLSSSTVDFDLDADGQTERISFVADGSGFLVFDQNGNGVADDGSELFGPRTGSGFAELAALDEDGNGWVDEGDSAYSRLGVWDATGLTSLAQRGVGAIALGNVSTPLTLDAGSGVAGRIQSTGIWLGENGSVGTVQHVDLAM